jgi:HSP20 family protein
VNGLQQVRRGLGRAWDNVLEGWQHLRENAAGAITRFFPPKEGGEVETAEDRIAQRSSRWGVMAAEVEETEDQVLVRLEAPGMDPDDFHLHAEEDHLVVSGEKRVEQEEDRGRYHVLESAYGRFERVIPLPAAVDDDQAKASYRRGVLRVTLPKAARARRRQIRVEAD